MPAYAIVTYRKVRDPAKLKEYTKLAQPTLKAFKAIPRVFGAPGKVPEGGPALNVVVLEFSDLATAQSWYDSPEYQQAAAVRQEAAEVDFLIVDGVAGAS